VTGLAILTCFLIVLCTTTKLYAGTANKAGNTAAAVFTFLMIFVYVPPAYLYLLLNIVLTIHI
jgi:hypothetical protein